MSIDLGVAGLSEGTEIGRGGFGVVYRAEQVNFGRAVAVKVLAPMTLAEDVSRRFQQECKAMAAVSSHPNIVTLYDSGVTGRDTRSYLIMELVPGGSLAEKMPVPWERAVEIGVKLSGALETAHRIGIFHRDVKPENILLSAYGEPKLTDFGIAKIAGSTETVSGHITASILHASPEILSGARPSVQTDVYSLASTIYALISGRAAFAGDGDEETLAPLLLRISVSAPPDLRSAGVPHEVCRVLERAMAKESAGRPASAAEFGRELADAQRALGLPVTQMLIEGEVPEQENPVRRAPAGRAPATNITPKQSDTAPEGSSPARSRRRVVVAAVAVLAVAGAGTAVALGSGSGHKGGGSTPPAIAAKYKVQPSCSGLRCTLTATGQNSAASTDSLQWTFSDAANAQVSHGPTIHHRFSKPGSYLVSVVPGGVTGATPSSIHVALVSHHRGVRATATTGHRLFVTVTSRSTACLQGTVDVQQRANGQWVPAREAGGGSSGPPGVGAELLKVHSSMTTPKLTAGTYRVAVPQSAIKGGGVCATATSKPVTIAATSTSSSTSTSNHSSTTVTNPTSNPTSNPTTSTTKGPGCGGPCS